MLITALVTMALINLLTCAAFIHHSRRRQTRLARANRELEVILHNQQTYIDELQRRVTRAKAAKTCRSITHRPNYQEIDLLQSDTSGTALVCQVWLN